MYLIAFPLLLVPFALYNIIAFLLNIDFTATVVTVPLLSGHAMALGTGDLLVILSVLLLYLEILKATRLSNKAITDHVLSVVVFVVMVIELIAVERAATATFFIITTISFVDVIGGFTISLRAARRDIEIDHGGATTVG